MKKKKTKNGSKRVKTTLKRAKNRFKNAKNNDKLLFAWRIQRKAHAQST